MFKPIPAALVALTCSLGASHAATLTQTIDLTTATLSTDFSAGDGPVSGEALVTGTVAAFDSSLGLLTGVTLQTRVALVALGDISGSDAGGVGRFSSEVVISALVPGTPLIASLTKTGTVTCTPIVARDACGGLASETGDGLVTRSFDAADWLDFSNAGDVTFQLRLTASSDLLAGDARLATEARSADTTLSVTYSFEPPAPIPLPAGLPLVLTAIAGLAAFARKQKT